MIFHDTFTIGRTTQTGEDPLGNPIYDTVTLGPFGCQVLPLRSSEILTASTESIIATLRLVCGPSIEFEADDKITWRGTAYSIVSNVEQHAIGGRLDHLEALLRVYAGGT